jgi:DNA (cytosine-5)-methyltransferase 1
VHALLAGKGRQADQRPEAGLGLVRPALGDRTADRQHGAHALVEPFITAVGPTTGQGNPRSVNEPLRTLTASNAGNMALVEPFLVPTNYGERPGQAPRTHSLDEPLPTVVGSGTHALVAALAQHVAVFTPAALRAGHHLPAGERLARGPDGTGS